MGFSPTNRVVCLKDCIAVFYGDDPKEGNEHISRFLDSLLRNDAKKEPPQFPVLRRVAIDDNKFRFPAFNATLKPQRPQALPVASAREARGSSAKVLSISR